MYTSARVRSFIRGASYFFTRVRAISRAIFHPSIDPPWTSRLHPYRTSQHYFRVGPQWTTFPPISFRHVRFRSSRPRIFPTHYPSFLSLCFFSLSPTRLPDDRQDVSLRGPRARIACRDARVVPWRQWARGSTRAPRYSRNFRAEALRRHNRQREHCYSIILQVQFRKKFGEIKVKLFAREGCSIVIKRWGKYGASWLDVHLLCLAG